MEENKTIQAVIESEMIAMKDNLADWMAANRTPYGGSIARITFLHTEEENA